MKGDGLLSTAKGKHSEKFPVLLALLSGHGSLFIPNAAVKKNGKTRAITAVSEDPGSFYGPPNHGVGWGETADIDFA